MDHRGGEEVRSEMKKKMHQIYLDFLARVQLLNETAVVGHRFLVGFHKQLDVLCQPPINKTSDVVKCHLQSIISFEESLNKVEECKSRSDIARRGEGGKANQKNRNYINKYEADKRLLQSSGPKRVTSYVEAGCKNIHNTFLSTRNLHTCHLGLQDYLNKVKDIVEELEGLVKEATNTIQAANEEELQLSEKDAELVVLEVTNDTENIVPYDDGQKPEIIYYASTMSILYSMVKRHYTIQMRIICSLNLNTTSEQLESYIMVWQPFIDDDLMKQAFSYQRQI